MKALDQDVHLQIETASESSSPRGGASSPRHLAESLLLERSSAGKARHGGAQPPAWLSDWRLRLALSSQVDFWLQGCLLDHMSI